MRLWSLRCPDYTGSFVYREAFSPTVRVSQWPSRVRGIHIDEGSLTITVH